MILAYCLGFCQDFSKISFCSYAAGLHCRTKPRQLMSSFVDYCLGFILLEKALNHSLPSEMMLNLGSPDLSGVFYLSIRGLLPKYQGSSA